VSLWKTYLSWVCVLKRVDHSTGGSGNTTSADNWDNSNQSGQNFGRDTTGNQGQFDQGNDFASNQTSKPSMGERVMGGLEKVAGKMTRNEAMQERGQERKEGAAGLDNY
jgi:hypothetical protein